MGGGFRGSSGGRGHGGNPFGGGGGYGFHSPPAAVPNNQRFFPPGAEIVPVPRLNAKRPNEIPVGDFNYFRSEGTKIVKWADDVYASKQPDRGPVNWKETYTAEYHDSKYGFASDFQDWLVKEFGHVFTDKSYRTASHKSKQAGSPAAYVNAYSKEKMAILALDNKREIRDQNTGPQARPWNGIVWDTWKEIAGPDAGKLRVVIQSEINNKDTQALIADIHKKHNIPLSERGEFHYASADPKVRDSFVALAGTDNAKGVIFMAAYHRHELGGARVTIIHTFEERMVLVLGRPEVKRRYLQIERGPYRARLA